MTSQLATHKRLLTRFTNRLDHIVDKIRAEKLEECKPNPSIPREEWFDSVEEGIKAIETIMERVEKELFDLAVALDTQAETGEDEHAEYEQYSAKAEDAIAKAFDHLILLQSRRQAMKSRAETDIDRSVQQSLQQGSPALAATMTHHMQSRAIELPPLPIPSFAGNIWEWDNFWEIFSTNVHSRNLPEMVKYNYLLDALKGEARESIMKFRVSSDNYSKAIECLLKKYNNKERLVNQLVEKLEACALRTPSIKDQRSLLEQLQAIVTQLQDKGEDVNSSWLVKRVLTKFPDSTKRKVITRKQGLPVETSFTMAYLFQIIDETLSAEEMFQVFAEKTPSPPKERSFYGKKRSNPSITAKCMYCKVDHPSNQCTKYVTPQERSSYLRRNKLCLICASPGHVSTQCKGRLCFSCNGPHHTSCCFKQRVQTSGIPSQERTQPRNKSGTSERKEISKGSQRSVRSNAIISQDTDNTGEGAPLLPAQMVLNTQHSHRSCLPSGEITVMDPERKTLMKVDVLFDTGAEISFIDSSLAERLHLHILGEKQIRLSTFGTKEVVERKCQVVRVDVWDQEGNPHYLELLAYDILTQAFAPPSLSAQDQEFLRNLDLPISLRCGKPLIRPSILLGCDLLWSFVRNDTPPLPMPSGFHILPTKLGYLVCGKPKAGDNGVLQIAQYNDNEVEKWEQYWTMNSAQVYTVVESGTEVTQEEREQWDQYWTMDSAGTEEFLGPEKEAQSELDKLVWKQFEESIERRHDGYYVRLPWKEQNPRLPDNRALAYKRLVNVWTSLRKDEPLLDQYNDVFQEQLNKGILERVNDNDQDEGTTVHYIPHQPVLTPHKSTTKLRIVFDASAHYRSSPSLNDVLHRGPVMLPSLYGLLLRFRIGKIALISDVEKAFLQVRLHEEDRDATRCLWLRDHKKPPSKDNTWTLRFTRVTFGLKSSPFLLAGTTHYHLDRHKDEDLAKHIKDNLYVDNVLLTSDTSKEALQFYISAKAIFGELNMNLREFSSNSSEVMDAIPDVDKANSHCPKVLGIEWNSNTDMLEAKCSIKQFATTNKRTITSAIATIYDPMGWYVPLLHKAKVFLQSLWKDQYEWDACLPKEKAEEWVKISGELKGYQKLIPRFLVPKMTRATLVVFADASATGMTACAYLHHPQGAHLLMAKSKLPSLHTNTTIPKLEMNAITLAARLANSIVTQLKTVLNIGDIHILSDSEIALCWIKSPLSRDFGIFVRNRLTEIKKIVNHLASEHCFTRFGHVSSGENPADCGTRGLTKEEFGQHYWWTGPTWLQDDPTRWPIRDTIFGYDSDDQGDHLGDDTEIVAATGVAEYDPELLQLGRVSTFTRAKRIIAYALRFVRSTAAVINRKSPHKIRITSPDIPSGINPSFLCGTEVEFAGKVIIKAHQTLRVTSNRGIDWRHITPYAPWQGGFYERLIKSVKYSLYKTIGRSTVSFEELVTVMNEIEAILNTRPLTYETTDLDRNQVVRPIDFLQKDICLSYPLVPAIRDDQDLDYIPPENRMAIQTKLQAISALKTSCKMTEKFWSIWQNQYLTSLREKHILNIGHKKGCKQHPQKDALVLICEATLPRHSWKMGIIHELVPNAQGTAREAVVRLPSRRLIRRPINLLVPLELEDDTSEERNRETGNNTGDPQVDDSAMQAEEPQLPQQRYNLRQRKNINYNEDNNLHLSSLFYLSTVFPSMVLLLVLMCTFAVSSVQGISTIPHFKRNIQCFEGGVLLESDERIPYEICADQFCITLEAPNSVERVTFPPDVVLHEHRVQWKFAQDRKVATIETNCPASHFCEAVDCTFCSANILNPECWPIRAIFAIAAIIYFVVTGCYVFLYVPLVVGRPFRVIAAIAWKVFRGILRILKSILKKTNTGRANRRRRLAEIIAIFGVIWHGVQGCQLVNVFNHVSTTCTNTASGPCNVHLSEVFKINAFKQEACVRLSHNSTPVHEIRLTWKSLDLICEPVTDFFTRDTVYRIVSSKRCSSKGSCYDDKCGAINASSLLPELEEGNKYPGNTACFESCGGLGCGCLTPSSGCLFYRIYVEPVNDVVYEIFHCTRWKEMAKIRLTHFDGNKKMTSTLTTDLVPNVPKKWNSLSFTLTSLSLPPLFLLNTPFIKAEHEVAMWKSKASPALKCQTYANAQNMTCPVVDDCNCRPAEIRVNCDCRDFSIGPWFSDIKNQLPATFSSLSFRRYGKSVLARIPSMVTSEVVMDFQGYYEPTILVDEAMCEIRDATLTGCYNCAKGARAQVKCFASRDNQQAEVVCRDVGFSIPCNTTGSVSTLRLSFSEAQVRLECSVSCGKLAKNFELEGILKFTGTVTGMVQYWLQGHSGSWSTVAWPDFFHIGAVFLEWYKTLTATIIGLVVILGVTYLVLSTWGMKIAVWLLLLGPRLIVATAKTIFRILRHVMVNKRHSKQH